MTYCLLGYVFPVAVRTHQTRKIILLQFLVRWTPQGNQSFFSFMLKEALLFILPFFVPKNIVFVCRVRDGTTLLCVLTKLNPRKYLFFPHVLYFNPVHLFSGSKPDLEVQIFGIYQHIHLAKECFFCSAFFRDGRN